MSNKFVSALGGIGVISCVSYYFDKFNPDAVENTQNAVAAVITGACTVVGAYAGGQIGSLAGYMFGLVPRDRIDWEYFKSNTEKLMLYGIINAGVIAGAVGGYMGSKKISEEIYSKPKPAKEKVTTIQDIRNNFADRQPKTNQLVLRFS